MGVFFTLCFLAFQDYYSFPAVQATLVSGPTRELSEIPDRLQVCLAFGLSGTGTHSFVGSID